MLTATPPPPDALHGFSRFTRTPPSHPPIPPFAPRPPSVQGYGKRGGSGWFYPGSGATADSTIATALAPPQEGAAGAGTVEGGAPAAPAGASPAQAPSAAEGAAAAQPATPAPGPAGGSGEGLAAGVSGAGAGGSGAVPEDPDGEFRGSYDVTVVGGPRVINVGVPGPGASGVGSREATA